jgi:hypothetical protein
MAVTIRAAKSAKLKNLEVTKVALVGAGSNPKANVALFKSANDKTGSDKSDKPVKKTTYNELRAARAASNAMWKVYDRIYDLQDAIYMSASQPEDIPKSIKQFAADVDLILDELASGSYEKADPNAIRKAVLAKMAEFATRIAPEEGEVMKIKKATKKQAAPKVLEEMSKEELAEEVKKSRAAAAAIVEKDVDEDEDEDEDEDDEDDAVAKSKAKSKTKAKKAAPKPAETEEDDDDDEDEEVSGLDESIVKSLPKPVMKLIKTLQSTVSAADARATNAEKIAKKEVLRREKAEMLTKAKKVMKHLPGTDEEKRDMLMGIYKTMPKEMADEVVKMFEAGSGAYELLGEEQGTDEAVTGSALEQLNTFAKEIQKSSATTKKPLTFEMAFSKACDDHNDLYAQHRREQGSRGSAE